MEKKPPDAASSATPGGDLEMDTNQGFSMLLIELAIVSNEPPG